MFGLAGIMPKSLVEHLNDYMKDQNLTQNELAKKIGVSSGGMSKIMSGDTKRPRPDMLRQIAHATGLTYIEINAMLDPLLSEELSQLNLLASNNTSKSAFSAKARLIAEEFDKLPAGTQEVLLALVLNYHSGSGSEQK